MGKTQERPAAKGAHTPDWVKRAVFYQIFPERFANGDPSINPSKVQKWGTAPALENFMGGDLQGIIVKLDYLKELGITALYLNPIFQATSNHKYNTFDFFKIDKHFGTLETFHKLIEEAHSRDMKVILDGVFNHCGRGLYEFNDVLENGKNSSYIDWFHIEKFPLAPYEGKRKANYKSWWDIRSLPKFNTDNPEVRRFLLDIGKYWIQQGADGWRLDVPNEIEDHNFWKEFRRVVRDVNPEAYIVGEIWEDGTPWLHGDEFDAVMNYLFRDLCVHYFAEDKINTHGFAMGMERLLTKYPKEIVLAQFNLLGSHDTARFLTVAGKDVDRLKLATLYQLTYPGAPCIYYGDEIGMQGEGDPHCRGCFPWDKPKSWNNDMLTHTKELLKLRNANSALQYGDYKTVYSDNSTHVVGYLRTDVENLFLIAINNSKEAQTIDMWFGDAAPKLKKLAGVFGTDKKFELKDHLLSKLELKPRSGVILKSV